MDELNSTEHKFLTGVWSYYQLHDFSLPNHGSSDSSLYNFISCFENFSPHCTVEIAPFGFEHLLCATLIIDIKTGAQGTLAKVTARKRKASAKQTPTTRRTKKRSSEINRPTTSSRVGRKEEEHEEEDESSNDENTVDVPRITKAVALKICLDPCLDLLFSSRQLPQWLQVCLGRCLGVTGQMELISCVRGDPRHIVQLVGQRGIEERDTETSSQAVVEHEWEAALQKRGRFYGSPTPLGPVTKMLGATPNNFPTVQDISATYRKMPLSSLPRPVADVDEAKLQECRQKLARLCVSSIKVHLSSSSLLHLYHNASREVYRTKEHQTYMLKNCSNVGVVSIAGVGGEESDDVLTTVPPTQVPDDSDDEREEELMEVEADSGSVAAAVAATRTKSKKTRKTKFNLEGVVTDVPFFIQRLRAKGTFHPVLEYK